MVVSLDECKAMSSVGLFYIMCFLTDRPPEAIVHCFINSGVNILQRWTELMCYVAENDFVNRVGFL